MQIEKNHLLKVVAPLEKLTEIVADLPSLNLFGLKFKFDGVKFILKSESYKIANLLFIYQTLNDCFVKINEKGYIHDGMSLNPLFDMVVKYVKSCGYKVQYDFGGNENTFTLWFNLIRINLYFLMERTIDTEREITFEEKALDTLSDLVVAKDRLFASLDPFIRVQIQKRGITLTANTYTGFDTEYVVKNERQCLNTLISVQSAIQTRVLVKVPLYNRYDISYVHPLTSEITTYFKPKLVN